MMIGPLAIAAVSGGGVTVFCQAIAGVIKAQLGYRQGAVAADVKLAEHRDNLTFELLNAAEKSIRALQTELEELKPVSAQARYLAEALDHLHALLHAEGDLEWKAASRRARAFLRKLRPTVGDLRNAVQIDESTKRISDDISKEEP